MSFALASLGSRCEQNLLNPPLAAQMAYECSSEHVRSFGFAYRMMMEMLGA